MTVLPRDLVIAKVEETCRDVSAAMARAAGEGARVLELDGSRVRRVDGVGIQLLVACQKAAAAKGLAPKIVDCSEELRGALAFTGVAERCGIGVE